MNVLENFKDLFIDVWKEGISGINISEIIVALVIFVFFLFLRGVFSKFVIKRLEKYVSKDFVYRPKMGFSIPIDNILREDLFEHANSLLNKREL